MPKGDKDAYTDKQKRKAEHIEEGYEDRGVSKDEAERRAWATVNKESGGGEKSGSGRGKPENHSASRKGGRLGGAAAAARPSPLAISMAMAVSAGVSPKRGHNFSATAAPRIEWSPPRPFAMSCSSTATYSTRRDTICGKMPVASG